MNTKKIYLSLAFLSMFFSMLFCTNIYASAPADSGNNTIISSQSIAPLADNIGWKYKSINGVLYKRQYNYSTNEWIGNWVKA